MKIDTSIIMPTADYVKQKHQTRVIRETLTFQSIDPALKALGKQIISRSRKMQPVRIPAMRGKEWGQVLRILELQKTYL